MNCPRWMFSFTYVYLTGERYIEEEEEQEKK